MKEVLISIGMFSALLLYAAWEREQWFVELRRRAALKRKTFTGTVIFTMTATIAAFTEALKLSVVTLQEFADSMARIAQITSEPDIYRHMPGDPDLLDEIDVYLREGR